MENYAFLMSGMTRRAEKFVSALDRMDKYEAEGLLLKVEYEALKWSINNGLDEAWKTLVREPYLHNGRGQNLSDVEHKLEQSLFLPYAHTVAGYLKRAVAAKKADGPMRDAMIKLLTEAAPICERLMALKTKIGKRAPAPTKTSMARDERAGKAMTCQCCGRDILAETGVIAHHGYQRPAGMGFQTASCFGAKDLPFEVSRAALGAYIKALENYVIQQDAYRSRIVAESTDIPWTYSDISKRTRTWERGVEKTVMVNRETFRVLFAETESIRPKSTLTFDSLKQTKVKAIDDDITYTERHIKAQQTRFNGWKQTHMRVAGEETIWVKL